MDGRRLSFAKSLHYKHNDMKDLERCLRRCPKNAVKLIVVDGVFSMEGDLCKLPEIVEFKHKFDNVAIMVDEAHGIGVFVLVSKSIIINLHTFSVKYDFLVEKFIFDL